MKLNLIILLSILIFVNNLIGQDCERPSALQNLDGNNIRTKLNNSAVLIDKSISGSIGFENAKFQIGASTLFANGLWFGAFDLQGNLKLSAETYGESSNTQFIPGPYPQLGNPNATTCTNYDRFFKVNRSQIENHLADFNDNQVINNPIPEIFGWPGKGNPEFESINGFSLPTLITAFAPFHDQNNDGIYNPNDGDFPLPDTVHPENIPDEILWSVFNDAISEQSLGIEIQMTAWTFYCSEIESLSNTIFTSHKIINKSGGTLSDMRIGSWTDFDIGCPFDDFIGSIPEQNSFYGYNNFFDLQSCNDFISLKREQTMSITFLNKDMSSFINFYALGSNNIELGRQDPETPTEYYNYLNRTWKDNTPLTFGGSGYNVNGGTPTPFIFPGHPNEFDEWSMKNAFLPEGDQRGLGVVNIDNFQAEETYELDIAYTSHHDLSLITSFELIDPMVSNIAQIQNIYNNQFQTTCTKLEFCEEDCVWPGDANADGIADYRDLMEIGLAHDSEGPVRFGPIRWGPLASDNWSDNFMDVTNFKHADCNGDGVINETDFEEITRFFYGNTREDYQEVNQYNEGPQLTIEDFITGGPVDTVGISGTTVSIFNNYSGMIYGLSFEIEYDTNYIDFISTSGNFNIPPWEFDNSNEFIQFNRDTQDDEPLENSYKNIVVNINGANSNSRLGQFLGLFIRAKENLPFSLPPITQLKFKNVRAVLNDGTPIEFGGTTTDLVFGLLTSIPHVSNDLPITIYPNPMSDKTHVDFNGFSADFVHLMDTKGRLLKTISTNQLDVLDIDLLDIPNGVYFLKVIGENKFGTFRLIKQ